MATPTSAQLVTLYARYRSDHSLKADFVCITISVYYLLSAPPSYKLWYNYLRLRRKQVKGKMVTDPVCEEVNNAFERALVFLHKVPYSREECSNYGEQYQSICMGHSPLLHIALFVIEAYCTYVVTQFIGNSFLPSSPYTLTSPPHTPVA